MKTWLGLKIIWAFDMDYTKLFIKNPDISIKAKRKSFTKEEWNDFRIYRYCFMILTRISYNFIGYIYDVSVVMINDNYPDSLIVNVESLTQQNKNIDEILTIFLLSLKDNHKFIYNVFELKKRGYLKEINYCEEDCSFKKIKKGDENVSFKSFI
ncbi:hypothetical protein ACPUEX_22500 [Enterobacter vonholyi]